MIDLSFNASTMAMLKSLVGKTFERYSCDPFYFSPTVFAIVGFEISGETYKLTGDLEVVERFFTKDDVAVMKIVPCQRSEIITRLVDEQMIDTQVQDRIVRIDVVNDLETVMRANERAQLRSTKGVVFYLASGNEISFEIGTWFSEMITILRGYGLVEKFTPLTEFLEEWEDLEGNEPRGFTPECEREVITLK